MSINQFDVIARSEIKQVLISLVSLDNKNSLMVKQRAKIFIYFAIAGTLASAFLFYSETRAAISSQIKATVAVGVCGNNIVEFGEQCDGSALDGQTCESQGFDGGTLSCSVGCDLNVSECVNLGPDEGSAVFSGTAYPMSVVRILRDGQIAATTAADAAGNFETTLSHLIVGSYSFAVYAYDNNGKKSKTLTYQEDIAKDEIKEISGIIVPPTISTDKSDVVQGETINFSGQSAALSSVNIFIESGSGSFTRSVSTNNEGYYSYQLDTGSLGTDDFTARAKTELSKTLFSPDSEEISFIVSAPSGQTVILGSVNLETWKCAPQTTVRRAVFSGNTNISEAMVKIEIRDRKNKKRYVIAETRADADGDWTWKNPVRLKRKHYLLHITLTDPNGSIQNFSYTQAFKLVKKIKKSTLKRCQVPALSTSNEHRYTPLFQAYLSSSESANRADLNGDSRVNLIDASIFLDQLKRNDFSPEMDLNADGKIDLSDFSILMHYWTG